MRLVSAVGAALALALLSPLVVLAQSAPPTPSVSVPRLININGVFQPADGQPPSPVEVVTLSIYAAQDGDLPLWQEMQTITPDKAGRFTVLLGATHPDGLPPEVFASGEARWMGMLFARAGEVEGPRVRITSVPYALKASDAETLGGRPASDYLLAPTAEDEARGTGGAGKDGTGQADAAAAAKTEAPPTADLVLAGTTNFLAKYMNAADVGNSAVFESGGKVGLGTNLPADMFHVKFTNTGGTATGLAVQNLGNTSASYSGMLFYDQNGALAQFQGFNNVSHEYRINNIASTPSINFMTTSLSRFFVASTGNIGIGTTTPAALLEVSNAVPGGPANMWMTSYTNAIGPYYMARRARGTALAPAAVQIGDGLGGIVGQGYGTSAFGPALGTGGMTIQAAENWTNTAQGTALTFTTTSNGTNTPTTRMTIASSGNIGIGTTAPAVNLEVSNAISGLATGNITASTYSANNQASVFSGRKARGTFAAPTGVLAGDTLANFRGFGYATTNYGPGGATIGMRAAENWTDTAQGALIHFSTTPTGTTTQIRQMTLDPSGNLGLGTLGPQAALDMVRESPGPLEIVLTRYAGASSSGEPNILLRTARGTTAAPSALQFGDELGGFGATGYGATEFGNVAVDIAGFAAENWTDTAQGAGMMFAATPLGSNEAEIDMVIMPGGNVGIGTFTEFPTLTDRLQVLGDIRVGTAGSNGCLKNFNGDPLAGSCVSDRRYKKDITPFGPALRLLTALQPVHYFWRAAAFPAQNFGDGRSYGLIAQEVEHVLPDLVVTGADGFKAVDYSKLPLLTIQAVKELKAENDTLKQRVAENEALKDRVAELERAVAEILATSARR